MEYHKHHIWPLGEGGPDVVANLVMLCPTTHANVHRLWRLYEKHKGRPPWSILKGYSEYTREIVERGRELQRQATGTYDHPAKPALQTAPTPSTYTYQFGAS